MKKPNLPPELPVGDLDACLREAEETGDDITCVRLSELLLILHTLHRRSDSGSYPSVRV